MPTLEPIRCGGCGAHVELDLKTPLPTCAFCGATLAPAQVSHGYDVVLAGFERPRLVEVVEALRRTLGFGYPQARDAITGAPRLIRCGASAAEAAQIRDGLAPSSARTAIVPCPGRHD